MGILKTILEYFLHASTWKGVIALLTAAGIALSPEQAESIIATGVAAIGLIFTFVDDYDKDKLK